MEFIPANVGDLESDEARIRAQRQFFYASKEASHLDGLKKLKQKFNRVTVLVLKHVDAQINLDLSPSISKVRPNQETGAAGSQI